KSVANSIFKNAERVAVRDIESLELAKVDGIPGRMDVLSDVIVSLTLDDIPRSSLAHAEELLTTTCGGSNFFVGIHLTDKYRDPEAFENICRALQVLSRHNLKWHFLLICDGASRSRRRLQQEIDANRILENLPTNTATIIKYSGHWDLVALISK